MLQKQELIDLIDEKFNSNEGKHIAEKLYKIIENDKTDNTNYEKVKNYIEKYINELSNEDDAETLAEMRKDIIFFTCLYASGMTDIDFIL